MDMELLAFWDSLLSLSWFVLCLAVFIVLLGWFLGGALSRLLMRIANRLSIPAHLPGLSRFHFPDRMSLWLQKILHWTIFLSATWLAWRLLASNPGVVHFAGSLWITILEALRLPAMMFLFDLAIISIATVVLFRVIGWVKKRFTGLARRIEAERGRRVKGLTLQKLELLSADRVTGILLVGSRYIRYAINLILVMVYLSGIFSIFPQTRGFVLEGLHGIYQILETGWIGFLDYFPNLISLIVIVVVAHFSLRFIHFIFIEISRGTITLAGFHAEWAEPTFRLVQILLIVLAFIIAFPLLPGSSSPTFQGISIFIGALLSLGSTSIVGNIIAGVVLIYTQAFRVGDRVQIAETVGDVIDKGLIATRVRTIKNVDITIPNGVVLASHIINYSAVAKDHGLILHTTVTIGYDMPWHRVHEALIRAGLATPSVLANPQPFILQTSLDNSYVSYELNVYTRDAQRMAVTYSELHQNIQDKFNEAKIEILSPQFSALRDGNASTIPAAHLPNDYRSPSFKVDLRKEG